MTIKNNQAGMAHIIPFVAIAFLVIGGSGYMVYKQNHKADKTLDSQSSSIATTLASPLPDDLLSIDKVKQLASQQKPATSVLGIELENENGTLTYKVKLSDGSVVAFDAKTGVVVTHVGEIELEGTVALPANATPTLSFAKARDIALVQFSGTVKKIQLEHEGGVLVYSVRFTDGRRVDVNAENGSIMRTKSDSTSSQQGTKGSTENKNSTPGTASSQNPNRGSGGSGSSSGSSNKSTSSHETTETHSATSGSTETETESHSSGSVDDSSHGGSSQGTDDSSHGGRR